MSSDNLGLEDEKPYASSAERFQMMDYEDGQKMRMRSVPDVPEDVLVREHLNDPNYDISGKKWLGSEVDAESVYESDRYSTTDRAESRISTVIEFDEYVLFLLFNFFYSCCTL